MGKKLEAKICFEPILGKSPGKAFSTGSCGFRISTALALWLRVAASLTPLISSDWSVVREQN